MKFWKVLVFEGLVKMGLLSVVLFLVLFVGDTVHCIQRSRLVNASPCEWRSTHILFEDWLFYAVLNSIGGMLIELLMVYKKTRTRENALDLD